MASSRERFWEDHRSFAVIGHSGRRAFPKLTYRGLKNTGKEVYAVDPGATEIDGDRTYPDLRALPAPVDAAVLELPRGETAAWMRELADAGVRSVWIHQQTDTPEALQLAEELGMNVCRGTCAVMYLTPGISPHMFHRWAMKIGRQY